MLLSSSAASGGVNRRSISTPTGRSVTTASARWPQWLMLPNQGAGHSGSRRSPMAGGCFPRPRAGRTPRRCARRVLRLPLAAPAAQAGVVGQPQQIFRLESRRVEIDLLQRIAGQRQGGVMDAHRARIPWLSPPFILQGRGRENPLSEVGVDAQVPGAARFVVGLGAGAVHRTSGTPVVWALPARQWRLSKTLSTPPVRLTYLVTSRSRSGRGCCRG